MSSLLKKILSIILVIILFFESWSSLLFAMDSRSAAELQRSGNSVMLYPIVDMSRYASDVSDWFVTECNYDWAKWLGTTENHYFIAPSLPEYSWLLWWYSWSSNHNKMARKGGAVSNLLLPSYSLYDIVSPKDFDPNLREEWDDFCVESNYTSFNMNTAMMNNWNWSKTHKNVSWYTDIIPNLVPPAVSELIVMSHKSIEKAPLNTATDIYVSADSSNGWWITVNLFWRKKQYIECTLPVLSWTWFISYWTAVWNIKNNWWTVCIWDDWKHYETIDDIPWIPWSISLGTISWTTTLSHAWWSMLNMSKLPSLTNEQISKWEYNLYKATIPAQWANSLFDEIEYYIQIYKAWMEREDYTYFPKETYLFEFWRSPILQQNFYSFNYNNEITVAENWMKETVLKWKKLNIAFNDPAIQNKIESREVAGYLLFYRYLGSLDFVTNESWRYVLNRYANNWVSPAHEYVNWDKVTAYYNKNEFHAYAKTEEADLDPVSQAKNYREFRLSWDITQQEYIQDEEKVNVIDDPELWDPFQYIYKKCVEVWTWWTSWTWCTRREDVYWTYNETSKFFQRNRSYLFWEYNWWFESYIYENRNITNDWKPYNGRNWSVIWNPNWDDYIPWYVFEVWSAWPRSAIAISSSVTYYDKPALWAVSAYYWKVMCNVFFDRAKTQRFYDSSNNTNYIDVSSDDGKWCAYIPFYTKNNLKYIEEWSPIELKWLSLNMKTRYWQSINIRREVEKYENQQKAQAGDTWAALNSDLLIFQDNIQRFSKAWDSFWELANAWNTAPVSDFIVQMYDDDWNYLWEWRTWIWNFVQFFWNAASSKVWKKVWESIYNIIDVWVLPASFLFSTTKVVQSWNAIVALVDKAKCAANPSVFQCSVAALNVTSTLNDSAKIIWRRADSSIDIWWIFSKTKSAKWQMKWWGSLFKSMKKWWVKIWEELSDIASKTTSINIMWKFWSEYMEVFWSKISDLLAKNTFKLSDWRNYFPLNEISDIYLNALKNKFWSISFSHIDWVNPELVIEKLWSTVTLRLLTDEFIKWKWKTYLDVIQDAWLIKQFSDFAKNKWYYFWTHATTKGWFGAILEWWALIPSQAAWYRVWFWKWLYWAELTNKQKWWAGGLSSLFWKLPDWSVESTLTHNIPFVIPKNSKKIHTTLTSVEFDSFAKMAQRVWCWWADPTECYVLKIVNILRGIQWITSALWWFSHRSYKWIIALSPDWSRTSKQFLEMATLSDRQLSNKYYYVMAAISPLVISEIYDQNTTAWQRHNNKEYLSWKYTEMENYITNLMDWKTGEVAIRILLSELWYSWSNLDRILQTSNNFIGSWAIVQVMNDVVNAERIN